MTKNNTKDNSASVKVAKVSDQIKAATAEAEQKSTAIKVNTGKTASKASKAAEAGSKSDSAVAVNIQKSKNQNKTASKTQNASKTTKANKVARNKRVLNVVELGSDNQPVNKAIDGMVKPSSAPKPDEQKVKPADPKSEPVAVERGRKTNKPAKKNKKKLTLIVLSVILVIGVVTGAIVWAINRNNRGMCKVTFESNGGSEVEDLEVVCGSKVSQPEDPEKEGFEFREWAYRGKKFDFNNSTVDEDIILVAKWDASEDTETVTISFDSAGGSEVEDLVIKAGTATMAPSDPTREGYIFDGWYLENEKFDFSEPIDEDITLVAHWSGGTSNSSDSGNTNAGTSRPSSSSSSSSSNTSGGSVTQQSPTDSSSSSNPGSSTGGDSGSSSGDSENPGGNTGDSGNTPTPGGDDNTNVPNPDSTPDQP